MDRIATRPGLGSQIWHFTRHFLEMCAAMCIGGEILNGLLFLTGPALLGYGDVREAPELALLVLGVTMRCRWPPGCASVAWHGAHLGDVGATIGLAT